MRIFLIILLTILVTIIASLDFRVEHNKSNIKQLGTGKKARAIKKLIEFYPGCKLFFDLIGLFAMIWIACLSTIAWGLAAGCFIALVIVALARLLGARLVPLTDQLLLAWSPALAKYMSWTGWLNVLTVKKEADPIEDIPELVELLRASKIDCPTQLVIERSIELEKMPISELMTKWSNVRKLNYRDKLTPLQIDELFQSKQRVYPVCRNDENDVVGLLYLSDVQTIGQTEQKLLDSMDRNFISVSHDQLVPQVLTDMAAGDSTVAVVTKNSKVVGLVGLTDIVSAQPVCR